MECIDVDNIILESCSGGGGCAGLLGCVGRPSGWVRPFGNVPINKAGAEKCGTMCSSRGYAYFGLECPMGNQVHCQCSNGMGGQRKGNEYCAGKGNPLVHPHAHCRGPYNVDGYLFGDYVVSSIYKTR